MIRPLEQLSRAVLLRALHLRLSRLREKIVSVENEITILGAEASGDLLDSPALESLWQRLCDLEARAADVE